MAANSGTAGRVAIITGASSGIGAELGRQLAGAGWRVGLTARRGEALESVAGEIRRSGGVAEIATADAADPVATRAAIDALAGALGPVDLLIANAGVGSNTPGTAFAAAEVERQIRVNLLGPAYAYEAVLPSMLARGRGHLVGISSLAGYLGLPAGSGYCSSKAGLTAMLRCLGTDLRGRGIAVTAVHPGYVRTPMIAGADHPLPFALDVGPAAGIILKAIAARRREVSFPRRTAWLANLGRVVPAWAFEAILGNVAAEPPANRCEPRQ